MAVAAARGGGLPSQFMDQSGSDLAVTMRDQPMPKRSLILCLVTALMGAPAGAELLEETLEDPGFGKLAIYQGSDEPKGVALFAAGPGGRNPEMATVAREIAKLDYVVAGINLDDYFDRLNRSESTCIDLAGDLDRLNRFMEQRYPIATHQPAILVGIGAGAALTYAALIQAPNDRFHAGVSVDFCPELALAKPCLLYTSDAADE